MRRRKQSAKLGLLAFLGLLLYMIASTSGAGWLYVISAGTGGVVLISVLSPLRNVRALQTTRRAPLVGTAGEPLECTLEVCNTGRLSRYLLEIEDRFAGDTGYSVLAQVKQGTPAGATYTLKNPRRGVYSGGEVSVESAAPFGLVYGRRRMRVASKTVIYPRTFEIAGPPRPTPADATQNNAYKNSTRPGGLGGDFWGVREYRFGDPARSIAWRQSARSLASGQLSVMELTRQTAPPLMISMHLDFRAPEAAREMIVSAGASLMLQATREGREVGAEAGPQRAPFPEKPDADSILTWCAGLEASRPPKAVAASVQIVASLGDVEVQGLRGQTVVLVSCREFEAAGPWMTAEKERELLDELEAGGQRTLRLGRETPAPWRLP